VPRFLRELVWGGESTRHEAFLSYNWSADSKIAPVLQSVLQGFLCPWYKVRARRIFRDLDSMPAGSSLEKEICTRLDHSAHLIVLACPEARASKGMAFEATQWISRPRTGDFRKIANGSRTKVFLFAGAVAGMLR
jgi:hypothetical protein